MRAMLNRSVVFGIALLISLLGIGAIVSYRNIDVLNQSAENISHTHEVDQLATELLRIATDAVGGQRGYLLSGDQRFLQNYQNSIAQLNPQLNRLVVETQDNVSQQERLADLKKQFEDLQSELERSIQLRNDGALEDSEAVAAALAASKLLDRVRDTVSAMRTEERLLLIEREDHAARSLYTALISSVGLFALGIAVFVGILEIIRRNAVAMNQQREWLYNEREQLSVTLASLTEAVITLDRNGRITQWNGAAETMTGRSSQFALGFPLSEVLRLTDEVSQAMIQLPLDRLLQSQNHEPVSYVCVLTNKAGHHQPVTVRLRQIVDNDQDIVGLVLVMRATAEERQAEAIRLERSRILLLRANVGMLIGKAGQTEEQLQQSLQMILEQLSATAACLWTTASDWQELRSQAIASQSGLSSSDLEASLTLHEIVLRAARERQVIRQAGSLTSGSHSNQNGGKTNGELFVWACPLLIEDRLLGMLAVYTKQAMSDHSATELELVSAKLSQFIERRAIEQARQASEMQLAESEQFLLSVLDALNSHISVLNDQGEILMVNQAWREFADSNDFGSSNYAVGQNYLEVCLAESEDCSPDAHAVARGIRDVIDGLNDTFSLEYPCHSPTTKRWFLMRANRFTSANRTRVVISHEDITSRVLSEEATVLWSEQQQTLADLALQLSGAPDREATLKVVITGACRLVDSRLAELVLLHDDDWHNAQWVSSSHEGKTTWARITLDPRFHALRERVRFSNRPVRISADELATSESSETPALAVIDFSQGCLAAPLNDRAGHNVGLICVMDKVSGAFTVDDEAILMQIAQMTSVALERARLYEEVREADQRKDQFLATLAHELRNPLSALTSGTQLIALEPENQHQVAETANLIARQCVHLKQLVDDLLDVSRISRGKLNLQRAPVCLQSVIQHAIAAAQPMIAAAAHTLHTQVPERPLYVEGDEVRLTQVMTNLLVNAVKYTPNQGTIELELVEENHKALLRVRDNGVGIPAEMLDKIFELFSQVDSSHSRSQGGLGIGLTLARTLVHLHHGEIRVSSAGDQQGSTFTVELPMMPTSETPQTVLKSRGVHDGILPRRILVVDDNTAAVHLLSRLLTSLGQDVRAAASGQEALTTLAEFQADLVISDIGMPDMSGYELARRIRQSDEIAQPVLVALTGYGQDSDRQSAHEAGFNHHLVKPVSMDDLVALLAAPA